MALKISYDHMVIFNMAELELRYPKKFIKGLIKYEFRFGNFMKRYLPKIQK